MSTERDAGLQALQQGNPAAAAPLLETACQQNPADFDALLFLGAAYGQIGRQMDAINTITRAVQVQPANAQARYNLAVAMEQGGYREQAVTALGQALTLQPDYPKAHEALRRLQGGDSPAGAPASAVESQAAPGYGAPAGFSSPPQPGYGQPAQPSGLPQPGFGRVDDASTTAGQPPAYPSSGGGYGGAGFGQPAGGGTPNQSSGAAPGYSQRTTDSPYAAQQPAGSPYPPPAAVPSPYAPPQGTSPYPAQQGPYPYAAQPMGAAGGLTQTFNAEYAGFGARFGAAFLDGILLLIVQFAIGFALGIVVAIPMAAGGANPTAIARTLQPFTTLLGIIIGWLYYALFESSAKQATLGKQAVGIVVTDLNGNRIGFGRASGRFFAKYISALILFIGYIMAAFTEKKQALHDIIAGTLVVKR